MDKNENDQNKKKRSLIPLILLLLLFTCITSSIVGYIIGQKSAPMQSGKIIDTILLTPPSELTPDGSAGVVDVLEKDSTGRYKSWTQLTAIDLFDGADKLYPGIEGEYRFRVSNTRRHSISFEMEITEDKRDDELYLPLKYRVKTSDGTYVVGSAGSYLDAEELDDITLTLSSGQYVEYVLEWEWQYKTSDKQDIVDTKLGLSDNPKHVINAKITANQI